ncbi:uncharacterized protein AKAW2_51717A [Aspergillus luchuensis]|uniref:Uncharacterized protein n=1 Tax=Aspergillus kawachii TaxID=1069201 RepID=A0A7R8A0P8_ASPKA|nr:uncharacterized protein AKAW2_51717A [Aspergillus luchuensis]BCS01376.1 hypothetical protein AKAW2_51717A [Aspergillus luchuensis]
MAAADKSMAPRPDSSHVVSSTSTVLHEIGPPYPTAGNPILSLTGKICECRGPLAVVACGPAVLVYIRRVTSVISEIIAVDLFPLTSKWQTQPASKCRPSKSLRPLDK